mmetsp:Transcript_8857/g.24034  ORF Transcript_8857/g.24034 Transcript_8857/m.24034 type:complete len:282 (-) Transcript_8857:1130-1975(-)
MRKRLCRFSVEMDLLLLNAILEINPFGRGLSRSGEGRWSKIVLELNKKCFPHADNDGVNESSCLSRWRTLKEQREAQNIVAKGQHFQMDPSVAELISQAILLEHEMRKSRGKTSSGENESVDSLSEEAAIEEPLKKKQRANPTDRRKSNCGFEEFESAHAFPISSSVNLGMPLPPVPTLLLENVEKKSQFQQNTVPSLYSQQCRFQKGICERPLVFRTCPPPPIEFARGVSSPVLERRAMSNLFSTSRQIPFQAKRPQASIAQCAYVRHVVVSCGISTLDA